MVWAEKKETDCPQRRVLHHEEVEESGNGIQTLCRAMPEQWTKRRGSISEILSPTTPPSYAEVSQVGDGSLSTTTQATVSGGIRGMLVGVNFVIVLLSLIVLWTAMYSFISRPSLPTTFLGSLVSNSFLFTVFMYIDVFLLILSSIFIAISTCGVVGALRENPVVLEAYQCFLLVIVLVNSVVALSATIWPQPVRNKLKESSYKEFIQGYRHSDDFQDLIDSLQKSMQCCGFSQDSFRDWNLNEYFRCDVGNPSSERCAVPFSCCRSRRPNGSDLADEVRALKLCGHGVLLMDDERAWERVYIRSCADAALTFTREHVVLIVGLGMLMNLLLVFLSLTAAILQYQVKAVSAIYDAYHKALIQGQAAMEESGITLPEKAPETPPDANGLCWLSWGKPDKYDDPIDVHQPASKYKRTKPIWPLR